MRTAYFLILTFLLGNVFTCQGISQNKSQTNQNDVAAKNAPQKLKLNNEEMGTTDDTSVLSKKLKEVIKNREDEGVFREGTNEIEKTVHLQSARSVSAEEMAKLYGVLYVLGVSPILIPVEISAKNKNTFPKPNPLMLVVYAGSDKYRPTNGGIEIGFIGQLSENNNGFPPDETAIAIVVDKTGTYTMDGKQISAGDLKTEIGNRLKTKTKDKKTVFVQADNYGNLEDVASIAASAGAAKVDFVTKNIEHKENDTSFYLSPAYSKNKEREQISGFQSVHFNGPESAWFELVTSEQLIDKGKIQKEFEGRKKEFNQADVSLTEIGGSLGVLTIQTDGGRYHAYWIGSRKKNGQQQLVTIGFVRDLSNFSRSEFLQIMKSIKFN